MNILLTNANLLSNFVINQASNINTKDAISISLTMICAFQSQALLKISPRCQYKTLLS